MILPETIAEIRLLVYRKDLDRLATAVIEAGVYHPIEPPLTQPGSIIPAYRRMLYEAENKLQKHSLYLREAGIYTVDEKTRMTVGEWLGTAREIFHESDIVEGRLDPILDALKKYRERYRELQRLKEALEPLKELDVDLEELQKLRLFSINICILESKNLKRLEKIALENKAVYKTRSIDKERILVYLAVHAEKGENMRKELRALECTQIEIPESLPQNPREAFEKVVEELQRYQELIEANREKLISSIGEVKTLYSKLYTVREALRFLSTVKTTGLYAYTSGFVPSKKIDLFTKMIEKTVGKSYVLEVKGLKRGTVKKAPSPTNVPRLLKPFHSIVTGYGHPGQGEIVPTLLVAITFPLLYSLMFPDAGHAIVIILFGAYLMKTSRGREGFWNTGLLAVYVGSASFITGLLSGEFFGPLTHLGEVLWHGKPPLVSPVEAANAEGAVFMLITIALRIAAALLILGTFLGLVNRIISREWTEAIGSAFPKFLAFLSATYPFLIWDATRAGGIINDAILGGAKSLPAMIVRYGFLTSIILFLTVEPIIEARKYGLKAGLSAINMMFMELFEVILMTIGNTASFLRLLGLSLAHSGLMYGFAILALLLKGGLLMKLGSLSIYIIGNLLTIGLEGIIVYAHTLRLHYYEWFTKFYEATGIPFQPVRAMASIILQAPS